MSSEKIEQGYKGTIRDTKALSVSDSDRHILHASKVIIIYIMGHDVGLG